MYYINIALGIIDIAADDDRVKAVIDSWRGVRPVLHYSYSRCEHLPSGDHTHVGFHSMQRLLEQGHKKQKLRAHSDYFPNREVNAWALSFWKDFDIQCEAKMKNLASQQLHTQSLEQHKYKQHNIYTTSRSQAQDEQKLIVGVN